MNKDAKLMKSTVWTHPAWLLVAAVMGALFGLLTIREGGAVLFGHGAARLAAGNYVPLVVWFNFLAGFVYLVAGLGLWLRRHWAVRVAFGIAAVTSVVHPEGRHGTVRPVSAWCRLIYYRKVSDPCANCLQ